MYDRRAHEWRGGDIMEGLGELFGNSGFMPHGHCFLWTPSLLWLYVFSDSAIVLSYYSIPVALWYFVRKRPDLPFSWIFVLFGVFVMACGTTHAFGLWNIWHADYWGEAVAKAVAALASIVTAITLWPLIPRALAMPSQAQLRQANQALEQEVARRAKVERELRQANQDLGQRTAQVEAANKELESFGYAVSHDLRAPLRAVHGFSEILARRHRSSLSDEGQHYLDNVVVASANMDVLINDLLRYSRMGRSALKLQTLDLNQVLAQIRSDFELRISEIGAELLLQANLPEVRSDRTLLNQILSNLIGNACTYRRADVPLRVEVSCQETANDWILRVADNGIGIASDQFEKIFIVFQRLHSAEEYPGTGIGLALVKKAAAMLGGQVWVESEPGKGSAFYVRIPRNQQESMELSSQ
jgi:signal transduction histidine kinase